TAGLVVDVAAGGDALVVGPLLTQRAGRGEEVQQRLDLVVALRVAREQSGHRRPRLDRLRVAEELAQVAQPDARADAVEDGGLAAEKARVGRGMAADAVERAEQQLAAASRVCFLRGEEALEPGHDRMSGVQTRSEEQEEKKDTSRSMHWQGP